MKSFLKLLGAWIAFGLSFLVGAVLVSRLHLRVNMPADPTPVPMRLLAFAIAGAVLVVGLWPLSRGLAASRRARSGALAVFLFLALGVNSIFDGAIYTAAFDGAFASGLLMYLLLAVMLGSALGGRTILAFLAWPLIYLIFGAMIAPIVLPYYEGGVIPGLHIPHLQTIVAVQLVRSLIFLASSLPLILLWKGTRRNLWLALGLAHSVAVGLFGLVAATSLPAVLRVTHGVEITCDSFAYAGLLVLLFAAPGLGREPVAEVGSLAGEMRSTS